MKKIVCYSLLCVFSSVVQAPSRFVAAAIAAAGGLFLVLFSKVVWTIGAHPQIRNWGMEFGLGAPKIWGCPHF